MSQIIKVVDCSKFVCRQHVNSINCIGEKCAHWQPYTPIESGIRFREEDQHIDSYTTHGKCGLSS